jgi:transcriptional regulator with XRE-family HTH domain
MKIPARLRSLMQQRGLSLTALAGRSGITVSSISRYLSGKQVPGARALTRLAAALEVSLEELTGSAGVPELSAKEQLLLQLEQLKAELLEAGSESLRDALAGPSLPVLSAPPRTAGSSRVGRVLGSPEITDREAYALKIADGANAPKLERGDVAIFSPGTRWKNGDVCVLLLEDGEFLVGRAARRGKSVALVPVGAPDKARRIPQADVRSVHKLVWVKSR